MTYLLKFNAADLQRELMKYNNPFPTSMTLNEPKVPKEGIKYGRELLIFIFIGSVNFQIAMKRQHSCHSHVLSF